MSPRVRTSAYPPKPREQQKDEREFPPAPDGGCGGVFVSKRLRRPHAGRVTKPVVPALFPAELGGNASLEGGVCFRIIPRRFTRFVPSRRVRPCGEQRLHDHRRFAEPRRQMQGRPFAALIPRVGVGPGFGPECPPRYCPRPAPPPRAPNPARDGHSASWSPPGNGPEVALSSGATRRAPGPSTRSCACSRGFACP